MNDHIHPIFQRVLNDFAKYSTQTMSAKEYDTHYAPLDDEYDDWGQHHDHEQRMQEQDEQEQEQ